MKKLLFLFLGLAALTLLLIRNPVRPKKDDADLDQKGEREHIAGEGWCHPTLFFDGGDEFLDVWVHKGNGEELPPSYVLASAVADAISQSDQEHYFPPEED
jgi:hypothetical protein